MKYGASLIVLLVASISADAAQAVQYKSVGQNPAVAYNAPSDKARKVYVVPRGMPVEIILTQNGWSKVRDSAGDLFWLEAKDLVAKHTVIATAPSVKLRAAAEEGAPLVATVDKGVLLELLSMPATGWVKVKHRDGLSGFARTADVWGE